MAKKQNKKKNVVFFFITNVNVLSGNRSFRSCLVVESHRFLEGHLEGLDDNVKQGDRQRWHQVTRHQHRSVAQVQRGYATWPVGPWHGRF